MQLRSGFRRRGSSLDDNDDEEYGDDEDIGGGGGNASGTPSDGVPMITVFTAARNMKGPCRRIAIHAKMEVSELSRSIEGAFYPLYSNAKDHISGLFKYCDHPLDDGMDFYPLRVLIENGPLFDGETFTIEMSKAKIRSHAPPTKWEVWRRRTTPMLTKRNIAFAILALVVTVVSGALNMLGHAAGWAIRESIYAVYVVAVQAPLLRLYRHGPKFTVAGFGDLGFWQGANVIDVCAQLTGHSSQFWAQNPEDCRQIVRSKEQSYLYVVQTLLFFVLVFLSVSSLFRGFLALMGFLVRSSLIFLGQALGGGGGGGGGKRRR